MTDPFVMEEILNQGKADLIAGLRYNIADPEFPLKVMTDRPEDIRRCVTCCRCIDDVVSSGKPLTFCGVNPRLGAELETSPQVTARARRVMIIGSGPAGLAAALTAHECGHEVTIFERGPRLGGCLVLSSVFSPTYDLLNQYYRHYLSVHPEIKIVYNTTVTTETVRRLQPDAVITAVGGHPLALDVPGAERDNVVQSHDFLGMLNGQAPKKSGLFNKFMWNCGTAFLRFYYTPALARRFMGSVSWPLGRKLAVVGGGLPGCELGKEMMQHDRDLVIFEERKRIGYDVGGSDRFHVTSAFKESPRVRLEPLTRVTEITAEGVVAQRENGESFVVAADTVAVTLGFAANPQLVEALRAADICPVLAVGDCVEPARMADATKAGYQAVLKLEE
jgi:2,4-dienoyl-CoA reductase (NADPH2)